MYLHNLNTAISGEYRYRRPDMKLWRYKARAHYGKNPDRNHQ